jgi:hypothetical protein
MDETNRPSDDSENLRSLARRGWKLGWALFALGAVVLATLYITKEPSRFGFLAGAFLLSMSVWILFASKFIEKRNAPPKQ